MKKFRVLALALALVLAASMLAGCSAKKADKDDQGRTIVSVGEWPSKEGKDLDLANERKARYEEANPDAVIEPDFWTFDRKTFYAKAAGGQLPTYFRTGFTEMPEIIASEYSADLTDVLMERGYEGMYNPDVLKIVSDENGRIKSLPNSAYVLGLAINTKLFEQAGLMEADGTPKQPKDWYEVAEFAKKIKDATGEAGIILNTADHAGGWIFTCVAWSFGVDFMEKDENGKWHATFDTPEAAEALQWYKDLRWKYDVVPSNVIIPNQEAYKLLGIGNGGMYITAGDISNSVVKYGMDPDDLGMIALPAGPKRHVTLLGGGVFCVNANATKDQIDAAIRWHETATNFNATEEYKKNTSETLEKAVEDNILVGIKAMSIWSQDAESVKVQNELIDKYANSNPNHVKLYNDFVASCPADIQPEEPVCCQELYQILDGCIQEVLSNENADPAQVLKNANADFQANYLDNLTY